MNRSSWVALSILLAACAGGLVLPRGPGQERPSVFELPSLEFRYLALQQSISELLKQGRYVDAERCGLTAIRLLPQVPEGHYNLACAQALQGKRDQAFRSLSRAVDGGFRGADAMRGDRDLAALQKDRRFGELLAKAQVPAREGTRRLHYEIRPGIARDGQVWVGEDNTGWDQNNGVFRVFFAFSRTRPAAENASPAPTTGSSSSQAAASRESARPVAESTRLQAALATPVAERVMIGNGEVAELLDRWFAEGTAAGHWGDVYDNHDGGHSRLPADHFPQLTRIEFDGAAMRAGLHLGLQCRLFYNAVTFGNCSMAHVGTPYWRSLPRLAYVDRRQLGILYGQYTNNHLYVYPAHTDHDPGHNGAGGYGDVFCTNTPFVIISQGSSGSDQPFLQALACTLAAFRPEVKELLARRQMVSPTLQMILRSCSRTLTSPEDYLTGKAHPTVFRGDRLDVRKMITLAHDLRPEDVPPAVRLRVVEEEEAVLGRDYFDAAAREHLCDFPAVIARVVRSTKFTRRLVLSAEDVLAVNQRPLTWHWSVLRGNAEAIQIRPLNANRSRVELMVPYHPRRPIAPGSDLESNRVDIGAFVHNGRHYSAPAFVTFLSLDNEQRTYSDDGRILSVVYASPDRGGNYVDPLLDLPKDWRDEYHYDAEKRLTGWTRHRGAVSDDYTADGARVSRRDALGRAEQARTVVYVAAPRGDRPPVLDERLGNEVLHFQYDSDEDRVGRVRDRMPVVAEDR